MSWPFYFKYLCLLFKTGHPQGLLKHKSLNLCGKKNTFMWWFWPQKATSSHFPKFLFASFTWQRSEWRNKEQIQLMEEKKRNENGKRVAPNCSILSNLPIYKIFICSFCLHLLILRQKQEAGNEKEETSCEKLQDTPHRGFFKHLAMKV